MPLPAHPENIDGVLTQGPEATGVLQAFQQAEVHASSLSDEAFGEKSTLAYWHAIFGQDQCPRGTGTAAGFDNGSVAGHAIRMLSGQRPILNTFYNVPSPIDDSNLAKFWKPTYKFGFLDDGFAEPTQADWMSTSVMNGYFYNGGQNCPTSPLLKGPMFPC